MPETLIVFEETVREETVREDYVKAVQEFGKFAKIVYISCPFPKGNEFQKLQKEVVGNE